MKFLFRKLFSKLAGLEAGVVSMLLVICFGIFTLLFIAVWMALYIGDSMASRPAGFGIVAGVFFFFFLVFTLFRKKSIKPYVEEAIKEKQDY